jgi:hypothetical protein
VAEHIYVNDRVKVVAHWSSFRGMRGTVTQVAPYLMVRLDGDRYSLRIEEPSVEREEASTTNLSGAE